MLPSKRSQGNPRINKINKKCTSEKYFQIYLFIYYKSKGAGNKSENTYMQGRIKRKTKLRLNRVRECVGKMGGALELAITIKGGSMKNSK